MLGHIDEICGVRAMKLPKSGEEEDEREGHMC